MPIRQYELDDSGIAWGDPEFEILKDELQELLECEDEEDHKDIIDEYISKKNALISKREIEQSKDMMDFYGLSWSMFI